MKKIDVFAKRLNILRSADFRMAHQNEIYRTGVIWEFGFTFGFACKALREVLRLNGAKEAETATPREILQLGYKFGFIDDSAVWLAMLRKQDHTTRLYEADEADDLLLAIRDSFIPAFCELEKTLQDKVEE